MIGMACFAMSFQSLVSLPHPRGKSTSGSTSNRVDGLLDRPDSPGFSLFIFLISFSSFFFFDVLGPGPGSGYIPSCYDFTLRLTARDPFLVFGLVPISATPILAYQGFFYNYT